MRAYAACLVEPSIRLFVAPSDLAAMMARQQLIGVRADS
jgi:hypothetical protein